METYIMAFVVGGIICIIGQLLMDLTSMTPAHVLVLFVVLGGVLSGLGIYPQLVAIGGAGATIPLTGFGHALVAGTIEEIDKIGFWGIFSGALKATAIGLTSAIVFGLMIAVLFDAKG